eukprot:1642731-Pyramimonas_sp.AAC.1
MHFRGSARVSWVGAWAPLVTPLARPLARSARQGGGSSADRRCPRGPSPDPATPTVESDGRVKSGLSLYRGDIQK